MILLLYLVISIILGGRVGYIIFYNLQFYIENPIEIFKIWQGGMSFHGGLLGVILEHTYSVKEIKFKFLQL